MARGNGWWGTPPLAVGAAGLLLLACGAPWMAGGDEFNENARRESQKLVNRILAGDPKAKEEAAEILKQAEKLPAAKEEDEPDADLATRLRDRLYHAKLSARDPTAVIAGRTSFYGGLVVMFVAGVLLYRRTPESNQGRW